MKEIANRIGAGLGTLLLICLAFCAVSAEPVELNYDAEGNPLTPDSNSPLQRGTEFIDIRATIEAGSWLAHNTYRHNLPCVVGTNEWLVDSHYRGGRQVMCWFTGTNIFQSYAIEAVGTRRQVVTNSIDSPDGNPCGVDGRRFLLTGVEPTVAWLAFCSGPVLKEKHSLFPVSPFWMRMIPARSFQDDSRLFEGKFAMPQRIDLSTTEGQPVLQYRVLATTNLLGWEFPKEIRLVQYRSFRPADKPRAEQYVSHLWQVDLLAKGEVRSIAPAAETPSQLYTGRSLQLATNGSGHDSAR